MKDYLKNEIKHLPFILIVFVLLYGIVTIATSYQYDSGDIRFDNTGTDLESVNVQDALDETFHHVTDYNDIKTTIGNSTLTTTSQTLTGAINELDDQIGMELLWTNANPNSLMDAQTFSIASNNYSLYLIEFRAYVGDDSLFYQYCRNGEKTALMSIGGAGSDFTGNLWAGGRILRISDHTSVTITKSKSLSGGTWGNSTTHNYPVKIYGLKSS